MKVLGVIPARSGSKRLPGKNLLTLGGLPLWQIALEQAVAAEITPLVSTDIQSILDEEPCSERRPKELARDDTRIEDVVKDILSRHPGYEALVLLNPTHPLRKVEDIKLSIEALRAFPSCTGVRKDYSYTIDEGVRFPTLNEQVRHPRLVVTGGIYAVRVPAFLERGSLMITGNVNRGTYHLEFGPHCDINTHEDYLMARGIWESR